MTSRLAVLLLLLVAVTGCPPKPKDALRMARCLDNSGCPTGEVCHLQTQTCVDVCAGAPCAVDQLAVNDGVTCTCVNASGVGSPCLTDGDCASPTPFASSQKQVCRAVTPAQPGWPTGNVCVPDTACTVSPPSCPDPDPSAQIEAACLALAGNPVAACTTACVNGSGPTQVVTTCRFDQIPEVVGGTCSCVPRDDPFGDSCTSDASCAWDTGLLGNAGPTRQCKRVTGGGMFCVPQNFCAKEETPTTCTNNVDDDCDGIADGDETVCFIEHCPDLDEDQHCDLAKCGKRRPLPGDRPRSVCLKGELGSCDQVGMNMVNPSRPELCNGIDDNCDTMRSVDEICQNFCFDGDDDTWTTIESKVWTTAPPSFDWNVCSPPHEHPTCDTDPRRHTEEPCGPPPIEPPPTPPASIVLRMRNVDDEAYAFLDGGPRSLPEALCATRIGRPDFDCDLRARFVERGRTGSENYVSVMLLNSGCGNAQGWFELIVNGTVVWSSSENPDIRHCGWVFRHSFWVNPVTGAAREGREPSGWESCALPHECVILR